MKTFQSYNLFSLLNQRVKLMQNQKQKKWINFVTVALSVGGDNQEQEESLDDVQMEVSEDDVYSKGKNQYI